MKVTKRLENRKLTVAVEGRLDTLTAPELEKELSTALEGVGDLVFDLADLAYISSAGLRVLVGAAQTMDDRDGGMAVVNANRDVRNIFDITGLTEALGVE